MKKGLISWFLLISLLVGQTVPIYALNQSGIEDRQEVVKEEISEDTIEESERVGENEDEVGEGGVVKDNENMEELGSEEENENIEEPEREKIHSEDRLEDEGKDIENNNIKNIPENAFKMNDEKPNEVEAINLSEEFVKECNLIESREIILVMPNTVNGEEVLGLRGIITKSVFHDLAGIQKDKTIRINKNIKYLDLFTFRDTTARLNPIDTVDLSDCKDLELIEMNTFNNCDNLKNVDLSGENALISIDCKIFSNCKSIERINLSNSQNLKSIGEEAFLDCENLYSVDLSNSANLEKIDDKAFSGCVNLREIDLTNSQNLKSIGKKAFEECWNLSQISLEDSSSLKKIGEEAFLDCKNLSSVDFSSLKALEVIDRRAFSNCINLKTLDLSNSEKLRTIGELAFENCFSLDFINFEGFKSLEVIGKEAFKNCAALREINLSNISSLRYLEDGAFDLAKGIEKIDLSGCENLESIGSGVFSQNTSLLEIDLSGCTNLMTLGKGLFGRCYSLEKINLDRCISLEEIDKNLFSNIGKENGLESLNNYSKIKEISLEDCSGLETIGDSAFKDLKNLERISFRGSNNIEVLGDYAFQNCEKLESIGLSELSELKTIGKMAFIGCKRLKKLDFSNCIRLESIGDGICLGGEDIEFRSGRPLESKEMRIWNPNMDGFNCASLEEVDLSGCESLKEIGEASFANCKALKNVNLTGCKNLKRIEYASFMGCENLEDIVVEDCNELVEIGDLAFLGAKNFDGNMIIKELELSKIGNMAFFNSGIGNQVDLSNSASLESLGIDIFNRGKKLLITNIDPSIMDWDEGFIAGGQIVADEESKKVLEAKLPIKENISIENIVGLDQAKNISIEYSGDRSAKTKIKFKNNDLDNFKTLKLLSFDVIYRDGTVIGSGKLEDGLKTEKLECLVNLDQKLLDRDKKFVDISFKNIIDINGDCRDEYLVENLEVDYKEVEEYLVKLDRDNGEEVEEIYLVRGRILEEPEDPKKEGYKFKGWYLGEDLFNFDSEIDRDISLLAKWEKVESPEPPIDPEDPEKPEIPGGSGGGRPVPPTRPEGEKPIEPEGPGTPEIEGEHKPYLEGYGDGTIRPEADIRREEVAAMVYRILEKEGAGQHDFPDIEKGRWSEKYIGKLALDGIVEGYEDGNFRPRESMTRAEFVTLVARAYGLKELDRPSFKDTENHWAYGYIGAMIELDWVEGFGDGNFRPEAKISRAEAVTILNRILDREVDKEGLGDHENPFTDLEPGKWYYADILEASLKHEYGELDDEEIWLRENK